MSSNDKTLLISPHLATDLQSGPESGPVVRFHRHQFNFYIIITIT